jgi:hypothetical protein
MKTKQILQWERVTDTENNIDSIERVTDTGLENNIDSLYEFINLFWKSNNGEDVYQVSIYSIICVQAPRPWWQSHHLIVNIITISIFFYFESNGVFFNIVSLFSFILSQ